MDIIPFTAQGWKVRVVIKDGQLWFVAKDVCEALGLGNPSQACASLDEDEKSTISINDSGHAHLILIVSESGLYALIFKSRKPEAQALVSLDIDEKSVVASIITNEVSNDLNGLRNTSDIVRKCLDEDEKGIASIYTPGGKQNMLIISESGLYALVFLSRKPEAQAFRRWITKEVIPAIRRTGGYGLPCAQHSSAYFPSPAMRALWCAFFWSIRAARSRFTEGMTIAGIAPQALIPCGADCARHKRWASLRIGQGASGSHLDANGPAALAGGPGPRRLPTPPRFPPCR